MRGSLGSNGRRRGTGRLHGRLGNYGEGHRSRYRCGRLRDDGRDRRGRWRRCYGDSQGSRRRCRGYSNGRRRRRRRGRSGDCDVGYGGLWRDGRRMGYRARDFDGSRARRTKRGRLRGVQDRGRRRRSIRGRSGRAGRGSAVARRPRGRRSRRAFRWTRFRCCSGRTRRARRAWCRIDRKHGRYTLCLRHAGHIGNYGTRRRGRRSCRCPGTRRGRRRRGGRFRCGRRSRRGSVHARSTTGGLRRFLALSLTVHRRCGGLRRRGGERSPIGRAAHDVTHQRPRIDDAKAVLEQLNREAGCLDRFAAQSSSSLKRRLPLRRFNHPLLRGSRRVPG
jgi:hypothetical protein